MNHPVLLLLLINFSNLPASGAFIPRSDCTMISVSEASSVQKIRRAESLSVIQVQIGPLIKNYFTSSDPHHDMLGGGCQVRVVI